MRTEMVGKKRILTGILLFSFTITINSFFFFIQLSYLYKKKNIMISVYIFANEKETLDPIMPTIHFNILLLRPRLLRVVQSHLQLHTEYPIFSVSMDVDLPHRPLDTEFQYLSVC